MLSVTSLQLQLLVQGWWGNLAGSWVDTMATALPKCLPYPRGARASLEAAATLFGEEGVTGVTEFCSAAPELGLKCRTLGAGLVGL